MRVMPADGVVVDGLQAHHELDDGMELLVAGLGKRYGSTGERTWSTTCSAVCPHMAGLMPPSGFWP